MRRSNSSRATGLFSVARLVVRLAADRRGEDLLAVDRDDEEVRRLVSLDADQPFGHGLQETAREHVLAVGRELVTDQHAAARAERQPFDVLGLRDDGADRVGVRARLGAGIADGELGDPQTGGQIALEQQRRGGERGGDVVEPEVAAVARQQIRDVNGDAEQIANRVRVFGAVQAVQHVSARVVLLRGRRVEARDERRPEPGQLLVAGRRRSLRRHRAHTELLDHALPGRRVRTGIGEIGLVERERRAGRKRIPRVVTADAVLASPSPGNRWERLPSLPAGPNGPALRRRRRLRRG